jgi:hypothetical protein
MVIYTVDSSKGNEVLLRDLELRKAAQSNCICLCLPGSFSIYSHGSAEVL